MKVAALFVSPTGPYFGRPDVDPWDEQRDARTYDGTGPIVAHPPCNLWVNNAAVNWKRYGRVLPAWYPGGSDGDCFLYALSAVLIFGGVLEHPAESHAWAAHELPTPQRSGGWVCWARYRDRDVWVCEVWQSAYGHRARKRTWLLYSGRRPPFELDWTQRPGTHQVGWCNHIRPTKKPSLTKAESSRTPTPFADVLIALAKHSKGHMPRKSKALRTSSPAEMTAHITGAPLANTTFSKDPVIHAIQQHAADFRKWAFEHVPVDTPADLEAVSKAVQAAKVYRDGADAHRKAMVAVPKRHLREIDKSFGIATKAFTEAIEHLQRLAGTFAAGRQQATQAALQAADAAFIEGRESDAIAALQTYNEVRADGVSDVEVVIDVEIVDPQAVPREYCSPDPELLRAAKLADPAFTCDGVTFTSTDRLLIRKKPTK